MRELLQKQIVYSPISYAFYVFVDYLILRLHGRPPSVINIFVALYYTRNKQQHSIPQQTQHLIRKKQIFKP